MEQPTATVRAERAAREGDRFARMVHLGLTLATEPPPDTQLHHLYDKAREILQADHVGAVLERYPQSAGGIELELTESGMLANPEATLPLLQRLRDMGVNLALDDFGTG